ncbi:MAG TPA: hypothetical protein VF599_23030 [Pyrinomonadaceae bacterium]|jgi:hypothetical protein
MNKLTVLVVIFGLFVAVTPAQRRVADLLVSSSKFKLLAENVTYAGEECSPRDKSDEIFTNTEEVMRIGDDLYYEGHRLWSVSRGDGLIRENSGDQTCRKFPLSGLAINAGWIKSQREVPDSTRGLFRVGQKLWMGSNGIGLAVYDLERKTWSRFDLKSNVVAGDHLQLNYADDDYAFITRGEFPGTSLHVYSVKKNKWLGLQAVPTRQVLEYGYTTGDVQVGVDHRMYSKSIHIPIDWTFMGLRLSLINDGKSYLFVKNFSGTKTVFEINKSQLEKAFLKVR